MTVNTVSRREKIEIGGLDVTDLLEYWEIGDEKLSSSGFIACRGSLKLRYNPKFNEGRDPKITLDPRHPQGSEYWALGQSVKVWISDTSTPDPLPKHPKHSLRIISSTYDPYEPSLTIELGCLLALLDSVKDSEGKKDPCSNIGTSIDSLISTYLSEAGREYSIPVDYLGTIPGYISSTKNKSGGGSWVSMAGKLAYDRGYVLWTNKDEKIVAIKIDLAPNNNSLTIRQGIDEVDFQSLDGAGLPPDKINVSYTALSISENKLGEYETITEERGAISVSGYETDAVGIISRTLIKEWWNDRGDQRYTVTKYYRLAGMNGASWYYKDEDGIVSSSATQMKLAETIYETFWYEPVNEDLRDEEECDSGEEPESQGRLYKAEKLRYLRGVELWADWVSQQEDKSYPITYYSYTDGAEVTVSFGINSLIYVERETTTYYYGASPYVTLPQNISTTTNNVGSEECQTQTDDNRNSVVHFTEIWKHKALISSTAHRYDFPSSVVFSGHKIKEWIPRYNDYWEFRDKESTNVGIAFPQQVDRELENYLSIYGSDSSGIYNNVINFALSSVYVKNERTISNTQNEPPSPEFAPSRWVKEEKTYNREFPIRHYHSFTGSGNVINITLEDPIEVRDICRDPLRGSTGLAAMSDDFDQAYQKALFEANLIWGRHRGCRIITDLDDVWFDVNYLPLQRFEVVTYDRILDGYYKYTYLVDGWSSALSNSECLCSFDGIWIGSVAVTRPYYFSLDEDVTVGATVLNLLNPITSSIAEGTPVIVEKVLETVLDAVPTYGSNTVTISSPLPSTIPANTGVVIDGKLYTTSVEVLSGSTTLTLSQSISSVPDTTQPVLIGQYVVTSTYIPQNSTQVYIEPATFNATITQPVVVEVPGLVLPASIPQQIGVTYTQDNSITNIENPAGSHYIEVKYVQGSVYGGLFLGTQLTSVTYEYEVDITQRFVWASEVVYEQVGDTITVIASEATGVTYEQANATIANYTQPTEVIYEQNSVTSSTLQLPTGVIYEFLGSTLEGRLTYNTGSIYQQLGEVRINYTQPTEVIYEQDTEITQVTGTPIEVIYEFVGEVRINYTQPTEIIYEQNSVTSSTLRQPIEVIYEQAGDTIEGQGWLWTIL